MVKTLFWYLQLILNKKDDFLLFHGLFYKNNPKKKKMFGGGGCLRDIQIKKKLNTHIQNLDDGHPKLPRLN